VGGDAVRRATARLAGGREVELVSGALEGERRELDALGSAAPVRRAFAAAHLVMTREFAELPVERARALRGRDLTPWIDWSSTAKLRRRFDELGLGVAEAMDTAQRFEVGWDVACELIERCGSLRLANGFVAGASADQLAAGASRAQLVDAIVEQARFIQRCGGEVMLLPQPSLVAERASEDDFVAFYRAIFERSDGPLFVHWLGEMFHPGLRGYFPGRSFERVMALDPAKVRGAKLSLLDDALELRLRRELAERDQIVLTGDDFHFADLIAGGGAPARWTRIGERSVALGDFSHALLGAFDAVALPASLALRWLAHGRRERALALLRPCEQLSRAVFEPPTSRYKAGLAFLAWLSESQPTFALPARLDLERNLDHFVRLASLASSAGLLPDAALAADRLERFARERT
jgi:hypothetical protein